MDCPDNTGPAVVPFAAPAEPLPDGSEVNIDPESPYVPPPPPGPGVDYTERDAQRPPPEE